MSKEKSLFSDIVDKYLKPVIGKLMELVNGSNKEKPLFFKQYLKEEESLDYRWGSSTFSDSIVAADVVPLGSPAPLKSRGSLQTASGEVPKLALKYRVDENDVINIRKMEALGRAEADVASRVLKDVPRAIKGIEQRLEYMFLQAVSTGYTLVPIDEKNGVRVSFGFDEQKQINATKKWSKADATPIDDIRKLFTKAEEDAISLELVCLSNKYLNLIRSSEQGKILVANYRGATSIPKGAVLPQPTQSVMLDALKDEFGVEFVVMDSNIRIEKADGSKENEKPFKEDHIVALPSREIGRLVYSQLAEELNPVSGVAYEKAGSYTLVSKYSNNDPLEEFTSAQAMALPVIDNATNIYILKADEE